MKYGFDYVENEVKIQKYKTSGDKIVITFLDGNTYEIPLTKENEDKLVDLLLEQAQDRSASSALQDAKQERKDCLMSSALDIWGILLILINVSGANGNMDNQNGIKTVFSVLGYIISFCLVINGVQYKLKSDEIKELRKYDIYLSMREDLEKNIDNPNLFNGVKMKEEGLNINTLDDYSLRDIQKIQSNLRKIEEFSQHFPNLSVALKLENKIGK